MPHTMKFSAFLCGLFLSGCALTSTAPNFNGLHNFDGSEAPVHINLTKVALHFGVVLPLIGDASLDGTVEEFTKAAKKAGADRVRIVQSDETTLWWIFPPFSFLFSRNLRMSRATRSRSRRRGVPNEGSPSRVALPAQMRTSTQGVFPAPDTVGLCEDT